MPPSDTVNVSEAPGIPITENRGDYEFLCRLQCWIATPEYSGIAVIDENSLESFGNEWLGLSGTIHTQYGKKPFDGCVPVDCLCLE